MKDVLVNRALTMSHFCLFRRWFTNLTYDQTYCSLEYEFPKSLSQCQPIKLLDGILTWLIHPIIYIEEWVLFPNSHSMKNQSQISPKHHKQFVTLMIQLFFKSRVYWEDITLCNSKYRYLKYFLSFCFILAFVLLYRRLYLFLNLALDFLQGS